MRTIIHLIRHGETDWNKEQRLQGKSDTPLNATGRKQALYLANCLTAVQVATVYTSPLNRARETALIIGQQGSEVKSESALMERSFGYLEGLHRKKIEEKWGAVTDKLIITFGGESIEEVQKRGWNLLHFLEKKHRGTVVIVVTHGAWMNAVLSRLDRFLLETSFNNTSITTLICSNFSWRISAINQNDFRN
ncbi:histidine phosphatase family protein [Bacillus solitudinis]|uniref:histidine phosphatase family protein n=1 Tax=Bacillus solitudinis TaxID=2014074 RepID=UPI000C2344EA|nr:histidine phosphatase family protein [Bacillus solitudinis]